MTNDKTVTMSRELAERMLKDCSLGYYGDELRALLAAPVVERQEPVAQMVSGTEGNCCVWFSRPPDGTLLYTSPPAPVAVAHPELGSNPEHHMRWLLDKVVNPGDYPQAVLHDQIRSTLACLDKPKEPTQ